jgi:CheY-like chemotaxis protein/PAS domain-containing protein
MPDKWHGYVIRLKDQIAELKETLQLISSAVEEQRHRLEQLTRKLRVSLEQSAGASQPLHQLPSVLKSILDNPAVGAILVGPDGRYLLFNAVAEAILGSALTRNMDPPSSYGYGLYLADKVTRCDNEHLPWQQCAHGASTQEVVLFVRRPGVRDGIWIRTISMPIRNEQSESNGAVSFLVDTTEQIHVEEQIKQLLNTLEQQLSSIEMAHTLLAQLTSKLSHADIASQFKGLDMLMMGNAPLIPPEAVPDTRPVAAQVADLSAKAVASLSGNGNDHLDSSIKGIDAAHPLGSPDDEIHVDITTPVRAIEAITTAENATVDVSSAVEPTGKAEKAPAPAKADTAKEPKPTAEPGAKDENSIAAQATTRATRVLTNRVLIVDDIPVNQKLLRLQLKRLGFDVETACNGKEAVDAVVKNDYDIVFMDLDMPVMDGPSATAAIRKIEAVTLKHVPIVAMTSYDRDVDRDRCLQSGMDDYLVKGATQKQLNEVINKFVKQLVDTDSEPARLLESQSSAAAALQAQPLDIDSLQHLHGKEEMQEVSRLFYSSVNTFVECIQLAIDERNADAVNHFAHCIKGPAASMGLNQLTAIITEMIGAAETGDWTHVRFQYMKLKSNFSQVLVRLKDICGPEHLNANTFVGEVP